MGREPTPDVAPYNEYKRSVVEKFLEKLRADTKDARIVTSNVCC
jgi:hypothetical protein